MVQLSLLLIIFLTVFLLRSATQWYLNQLNISYLRRNANKVPEEFQDTIDQERLGKILSYTMDSDHFHMVSTLANQGFFLAILLSGFLPWLVKIIHSWGYGPIMSGMIFFAALSILTSLFQIPFSLYDTFAIEERHGFNVMSLKMWISDFLKSLAITAILGGLLLWLLLFLVLHGGNAWWIWAWMLVGGFELLMLWLFPVVIAPLFNKFESIDNEGLETRIRAMMEKVGLWAKGVFKMDAGKRSKHTNAYFTGVGKSKRIVLFDTLLASHTEDEILAVLAHEIGHWKKKHVLKQILLLETLSLAVFYIVSKTLNWPLLYQTFGFQGLSPYVGIFLSGTFINLLGYFAQPLESILLRNFECEADDFSLNLMKTAEPMRSALKRLAVDNLANLTPHPLYAWFYYSHPPLVERISRLTSLNAPSPFEPASRMEEK
jgi:STE24 endopeptidase